MKRRDFLKASQSSILALPLALNGINIGAFHNSVFDDILSAEGDRVFVLIQLNGGNDGLNTIIPLDRYDRLMDLRSNIMIPEQSVLSLTDTLGLHPAMSGIKNLFDQGQVNVVQNVGYENQNRSHFRSTDIWKSGSQATEVISSGWLGRFFDFGHPGYPNGYPNSDSPHPIAITLGPSVSETCQGLAANFSVAIRSADSLVEIPGMDSGDTPDSHYGQELLFVRQIKEQTNQYAEILVEAAEKGENKSQLYPDPNTNNLADQLKIVASLIAGGLQTRIYVVNINGFDTHASQVDESDTTSGEHAVLLGWLSEAVAAFMDDLKELGLGERVLLASQSEFGRKIISNGSLGTDHGDAAPLLVFGQCVTAGVTGDSPDIPEDVSTPDGVEMKIDFKNVFGSILIDWLGASEAEVRSVFTHDFQHLPIVNACQATPTREFDQQLPQVYTHPNPFFENLQVDFSTSGGPVQMILIDGQGRTLTTLLDANFPAGKHQVDLSVPELPPGSYFYRLETDQYQHSGSLIHL